MCNYRSYALKQKKGLKLFITLIAFLSVFNENGHALAHVVHCIHSDRSFMNIQAGVFKMISNSKTLILSLLMLDRYMKYLTAMHATRSSSLPINSNAT